jgi:diguanylate cyclase (GGDEF)-like protein
MKMKNRIKLSGFTPQEHLVSLLPAVMVGIVLLAATIASSLAGFESVTASQRNWLLICGVLFVSHIVFYYSIHKMENNQELFVWINSLTASAILCALSFLLPPSLRYLIYTLVFVSALPPSLMVTTPGPSHVLIFGVTTFHFVLTLTNRLPQELVAHFGFTITAFVGIQTVQQLRNLAARRIKRLEAINELSRKITSTLEQDEVIKLLTSAFQSALEADAYYVGTVHGDRLCIEFLYDDGEYYENLWVDRRGTLSNWVINNQQELFLPDLRKRLKLEGVEIVTVGSNKPTQSWMGVPMRGDHVDGFMAISSYRPNAFDRSDMELLSNIAQIAILALDNAYHHGQVEKQAQLDSLTEVYNHGHFIKVLRGQTRECGEQKQPLSLIMLDVDYFKQYNDTFGHLIGDEVLIGLCNVIRQHIKDTDAVGRWGGEEFCVALPNASKKQAVQVAQRIRKSMATLKVRNAQQLTIPIPTVSQGIAVFPSETEDVYKLIDLADKRLYIAKKRGRDQVDATSQ